MVRAQEAAPDTAGVRQAMARATALGAAARRITPPWPWVGCVLLRDGLVIGEGATGAHPVGPHAEVAALESVGGDAAGATAVVTLEPCNHHGNTPPCSEALLRAGVERVVIACDDPDPRVSGTGIARLRAEGVEVSVGVGADAVAASLAPYLHHRRTGRPFTVLKTATSIDGRTTAADGTSRWITGDAARRDVHRLRAESQAIVVGAGTAVADRPSLTVRDAPRAARPATRVLVDASGRVPAEGPLFDDAAPVLVCTSDRAPAGAVRAWRAAGARVEVLPTEGRGVAPGAILDLLGADGVLQVLVEGGASIHGAFLRAGGADRVVAYVAPTMLGASGLPAFGGDGPRTIGSARRWRLVDVTRFDDDIRATYDVAESGR